MIDFSNFAPDGFMLVENKLMADIRRVQFKFPRTKKKRILKKWKKNSKNFKLFEIPKQEFLIIGNKIIGHPHYIKELLRWMNKATPFKRLAGV